MVGNELLSELKRIMTNASGEEKEITGLIIRSIVQIESENRSLKAENEALRKKLEEK